MKLYVCWNTNPKFIFGSHPCGIAYEALREAGHDPEVVKAKGWRAMPDAVFNRTDGRQEVKRLTGKVDVPVLVTDEGEAISESKAIVEWAKAHPAPTAEPAQTG